MKAEYPDPPSLIEALQQREPAARAALHTWIRQPVERLLEQMLARHQLPYDRETLVTHALCALETHLRSRPAAALERMSWQGFRAMALLQAARLIGQPFGHLGGNGARGPSPLPSCPWHESQILYRPYERVGNSWFGGDWYAGAHGADGTLWVIVADVTGHGYHAYLLASTLPDIWASCWQQAGPGAEPAQLLRLMHDQLSSCLPEGIYLECTLVRLSPEGEMTVAPAGGSRLLLRRPGEASPELIKLRGAWLGLLPPSVKDQRTWLLTQGDEVVLGTDGLFDHLGDAAGEPAPGERLSLFEHCRQLLERVLRVDRQQDDITMIHLLRRIGHRGEGSAILSFPGTGPAGRSARRGP